MLSKPCSHLKSISSVIEGVYIPRALKNHPENLCLFFVGQANASFKKLRDTHNKDLMDSQIHGLVLSH